MGGKQVRPAPDGDGWWSDLNPLSRSLALKSVLATADASEAWDTLAQGGVALPFEVHVWKAELQSGCQWEGARGLTDMRARLPVAKVRVFKASTHSIHWSNRNEFVTALREVINDASIRLREGSSAVCQ